MYTKETYVAGLFDVSKVRHTSELVIQKLQETLYRFLLFKFEAIWMCVDS